MDIMKRKMDPARLDIFSASPEKFRLVGQVRVLDIFQNNTRDFHEAGLFSTQIFGRVGSDERLVRFGYIDTHVPILHPRIFNHICTLKQLYRGIISGKEYAIWDSKEKDFIKADQLTGETGYYFFLKHFKDINFARTRSSIRDVKINLVRKNIEKALTSKILVIPAGLRDLEVDEFGGIDQHEMNDFYRNIIRISSTLSTISDLDSPVIDRARFSMQLSFNELHDFILDSTTKGKGSFAATKFGRRKIKYGTRNVIGAVSITCRHLDDDLDAGIDDTKLGLYQAIKATEPLMIHHLKAGYLDRIFGDNGYGWLVDTKNLQRVEVQLQPKTVDKWTSVAGLTKLINGFENVEFRNKPIIVDGHYLGLVYKRDGQYRLMYSLDELRPDVPDDKNYVFPLTYGELFFILNRRYIKRIPLNVTRYPIEGAGSFYPSFIYVTTTTKGLEMVELDEAWNKTDRRTREYPDVNIPSWRDVMGPSPIKLVGMGGDFDGDTCNANASLSEEAIQNINDYMNSINYHISTNNKMLGSPLSDIPVRVIYSLTGDAE